MDSLFDPSKESISFEPFQAYLVFFPEQIDYILVMHKADTDGSLKMSPYLRRITEYLSVPVEKEHLTIESDPNCYVGTYRSGINTVNRIYRLALDEKPVPKHWQSSKN